jgi:hypothetical protein
MSGMWLPEKEAVVVEDEADPMGEAMGVPRRM